jgi:hypothetical protein
MEGIHLLQELIRPGDFFTKIDLKDAYLTLPLRKEDRKFVKVKWGEVFYQFKTLAFGLSSAPWIFTKVLKPVITFLRKQGVRLIIYLDDILLLNNCEEGARKDFLLAKEILENCGFLINIEKTIEEPTQIIEYLGLIVNSLHLSLSLRHEKLVEILHLCNDLMKRETASLREISKILGNLAWAVKCIPFAQAHYRALQRFHINGNSRFNGLRQEDPGRKMTGIDTLMNSNYWRVCFH